MFGDHGRKLSRNKEKLHQKLRIEKSFRPRRWSKNPSLKEKGCLKNPSAEPSDIFVDANDQSKNSYSRERKLVEEEVAAGN